MPRGSVPKPMIIEDDDERAPSKSQRKRDARALQSLAEELIRLSAPQLEAVPLPDDIRDAVRGAGTLKRGAYQRQVRYLGGQEIRVDAEGYVLTGDRIEIAGDRALFAIDSSALGGVGPARLSVVFAGTPTEGEIAAAHAALLAEGILVR